MTYRPTTDAADGGGTLVALFTAALVFCKLAKVTAIATWSWWQVLAPVWVPVAAGLTLFALWCAGAAVVGLTIGLRARHRIREQREAEASIVGDRTEANARRMPHPLTTDSLIRGTASAEARFYAELDRRQVIAYYEPGIDRLTMTSPRLDSPVVLVYSDLYGGDMPPEVVAINALDNALAKAALKDETP